MIYPSSAFGDASSGARPATSPPGLGRLFLLALVIAAGLRAFSYGTTGLDWDESLYIVIAQQWLRGAIPYGAIWDLHPMGVPALFALATAIVGDGLLAARLAALLAVAATAALLCALLDRHARRPAGLLAGLFYLLTMTRPEGLAGNTEVFNNLAVTAAATILANAILLRPGLPQPVRLRPGQMFAAALLLGIGLQLKYVVFPEAVALCGAALVWQLASGAVLGRVTVLAGAALVGGVLPTLAATGYFWWAGVLPAYLDANLRANVAYLSEPVQLGTVLLRLRYGLLPIIGLLPWPLVLLLPRARPRDRVLVGLCLWLAVWLVAAAVDVVLPMKFWKHYFNALVPPLCALAGLAIVQLARNPTDRPTGRATWSRRAILAGVLVVAVPAVAQIVRHAADSRTLARANVPLEIANRIKAGGTDGHDVYVVDYDPLVYAYAEATPPTRFVLGIGLSDFSASTGTGAETEIGRVLDTRPRWLVVAEPSPYAYPPAVWRRLEATLRDYQLETRLVETDYIQPPIEVSLYRHRTPG